MRLVLTLTLLGLLAISGCEKKEEEKSLQPTTPREETTQLTAVESVQFLREPLTPFHVETSSEALVVWRSYHKIRPALILVSNDPLVMPIPEELQDEATAVLSSASDQELRQAVSHTALNPILLPPMALTAALDGQLFSRVIWVLPVEDPEENFSWNNVKQRLAAENFPDAASFDRSEFGLSGSVLGTAVDIVHAGALPPPTDSALVHIDLSYFSPLYKGEIKTPLYPLLYQTLAKLRDAGWQAVTATICPGNATGRLPLETRFLAGDLATIVEQPALLDQRMPLIWRQRAQALYLENFMQSEKILDTYENMKKNHPEDASIRFGLYQALRKTKQGTEALAELDKAVQYDNIYGIEYMNLVPAALEKNTPAAAIQMLQKAMKTFPEHPIIKLELASTFLRFGQGNHALPLLQELQALDWSPVYYPEIPELLRTLRQQADSQTAQQSAE